MVPVSSIIERPAHCSNACTSCIEYKKFKAESRISTIFWGDYDGIVWTPVVGGTLFRAGGTLLLVAVALTPGRAPPLKFENDQRVIFRENSSNLEFTAAGLPAMFIMDLLLLLTRLEAGSGAPRDFLGSRPVSRSNEPSRRRFDAAGNASLDKILVTNINNHKNCKNCECALFQL